MANYTKTATAFVARKPERNGNMRSTGDRCYSYDEVIAKHLDGGVVSMTTKTFSRTTSAHQSAIRYALALAGYTRQASGEGEHLYVKA